MKPTNSENASVIMLVALLAGLGLTFAVQNPVDPKPPVDNVVVEGEPTMES